MLWSRRWIDKSLLTWLTLAVKIDQSQGIQELVYRNDVLKTMLTGSFTRLSPATPRFSRNFSLCAFPTILEPETGYLKKGVHGRWIRNRCKFKRHKRYKGRGSAVGGKQVNLSHEMTHAQVSMRKLSKTRVFFFLHKFIRWRQRGRVVRALDLQFWSPELKSHSDR